MDGNVHTFKANLVAKGYTLTYDVEYGETFSPIADIKAIRILLAIAASNVAFLILYVEDILLMGNNITMLQEVKSWLCSIMYVVRCTRPDVAFAQNLHSRFQQNSAGYIAAAEEAVWMRKFIGGLRGVVLSNKRPMEMLCDNEPAIAITNDPEILKGARHFQRKYHYIREVIQEREIVHKKVHTYDKVADPFTKPVSFNKHYEHAMAIGIVPASSLMYGKVVDVYVAFKRTKKNTWFGFVRFINIWDIGSFERKLKGILIGDSNLMINAAIFFKDDMKAFSASDFPLIKQRPTTRFMKRNLIPGSRLENCWVGKAKNFHVLQNAWDIIDNNRLSECKVKYIGGLSFLFEWNSKDSALKSLETNKIWMQQWFDDLKLWEDNGASYGWLSWLIIEGLPPLARNLGAVRSTLSSYGKILKVGRSEKNDESREDDELREDEESTHALSPCIIYRVLCSINIENCKDINARTDDVSQSSCQAHCDGSNFGLGANDVASRPVATFEVTNNVTDLNVPLAHNGSRSHKDNELDELFFGLQRLSQKVNDNQSMGGNKKRSKPKKAKVETRVPPPLVSCNDVNGNDLDMKAIGEQIGLSFVTNEGNGLHTDNKKSWVKGIIDKESPLFLGVQETKMEGFYQALIRSFWPHPNFNFAFSSAIGASGGILTMWNSCIFNMERKFVDRNFLGVLGHWSGVVPKVGLLNVYAPQLNSQKDSLWEAIESLVNSVEAVWIIFGDFNAVRSRDERMGCTFDEYKANSFNNFISRIGLFDFPLGGRRFTRFDNVGSKASKLDRFQVGMPNFGPKPFRIFDKWIGFPEMLDLISTSWAFIKGWPPDLLLKNKLKKLKTDIKKAGLITLPDVDKREEWMMDLNILDQLHRDDLMQKSRVRWAVEGDENSRFFHYTLKNNYANFSIKGIHVNGVWSDVPDVIKNGAFEHFSSRFKESQKCRPLFSSPLFRKLSSFDASFLKSSISLEEIKLAVWDCDGTKAPGPDGFNFKFLKAYWDTIKDDFLRCIKYFEETGNFANGCNPSFIVLIPKKQDPLSFSDYRPISLIGCVYKVVSKVLASRMAKVISSIIGPNQTALISGRQILDGCLVANEIIRMASIENHKLLLFKVDFEKAFDSVNWLFLQDVMRQMRFGEKWRKWISTCLTSASISILVNGSPSKEFKMERGLRQGDPISPLLFLLVVESLQISILEACNKGLYKGISLVNGGANISLLQYADDALFFGNWSRVNAYNLILILNCFEEASGLKVNISKSRLFGIRVSNIEVECVVSSLGCTHDTIPFMYLSLPLVGGLLSLSLFYAACLYTIYRFLEPLKRCSSFSNPSAVGSFGDLRNLNVSSRQNLRLLSKWKWRYLIENNALWRNAISSFYGDDGGFGSPSSTFGNMGVWCNILRAIKGIEAFVPTFKNSFKLIVGNGLNVSFWKDPWCGDGSRLMDVFPRLFALESRQDCKVNERWCYVDGVWGASIDRPATRPNLVARGVNIESDLCALCDASSESTSHCLVVCPRVKVIWRKIWSWWNLATPVSFPSFDVLDICMNKVVDLGCSRLNKVIHGVFQCGLWAIWKWRNKLVHASSDDRARVLQEDIFPSIQRLSRFRFRPVARFQVVIGVAGFRIPYLYWLVRSELLLYSL
ncbi:putative RNA-directed DNA polymerase [Tanacetum coccineum]